MADIYTSLCTELDNLLVNIIEEMENYIATKVQIERVMNEGFVNIAKTRYLRGSTSVTAHQLPTENSKTCSPLATVVRTPKQETTGYNFHIENKLTDKNRQQLKLVDKKCSTEEEKIEDPIRLFGVLVPPTLRQSQNSFLRVLDHVGPIAEAATSLDSKLKRYEKLSEMKLLLSH